ncbi:Class II abasic (AP) endonuclease [Ascosphaera aggregata]|nr:Class II abasic (AP) endonuclease [Ascosphaera aggregata]
MQETKIQRKDLRDDMVLIPGWDCFFSFPKYKKGANENLFQSCYCIDVGLAGYSGVAIYIRNAACSPLKAEDGITGANISAKTGVAIRDLPIDEQIGGYLTSDQLRCSNIDAETIDSEGRCVILEFFAFVLLGVYLPAVRNELRDDFRLAYLRLFECRIRNLIAMGKRVVVMGDLNISRDVEDSAAAMEDVLSRRITREEYLSTPARSLFNGLVTDRSTFIASDGNAGTNNQPVLWDLCRDSNPGRRGMFTCWDTKINARPGNFGSRLDYILCSENIKDWFLTSDVRQHFMVSRFTFSYSIEYCLRRIGFRSLPCLRRM